MTVDTPHKGSDHSSTVERRRADQNQHRQHITDTFNGLKKHAGHKFIPSVSSNGLPRDTHFRLNELAAPHVQSFNYMLDTGLPLAISDIPAREFRIPTANDVPGTPATGKRVQFWIEDAVITHPMKNDTAADNRLYPSECRERGISYAGPLLATFARRVEDGMVERVQVKLGNVPIMVRSNRCHIAGLSAAELVKQNEEPTEFGGYFICNGIERVIRMLQMPRRNYPMAITRGSYVKRGALYSNKAVVMRCVRPDQSSITLTLHYLRNGNAMVRFSLRRQEFFLPVVLVLKALRPTTDREIYERVLAGDHTNTYLSDRMELLLRDTSEAFAVRSRQDVLGYIGSRFRSVLDMPDSLSDEDVGRTLLQRFVLVHLDSDTEKFDVLTLMLRKLYAFVAGKVTEDNPDSLANQELLLGGHLYLIFLKEKLEEMLKGIEENMKRDIRMGRAGPEGEVVSRSTNQLQNNSKSFSRTFDLYDLNYFRQTIERQPDIGRKVYYLLATGTLVSSSGLDLMQASGFTVVADKINFLRFVTHFRSVHRGQFFTEMKTTAVRKLLPEYWGFLCPVHTPDGAPCGLLNHVAAPAHVVTHPVHAPHLPKLLVSLGATPFQATGNIMPYNYLPIMLDGKIIGGAPVNVAVRIVRALRNLKAKAAKMVSHINSVSPADSYSHLANQRKEEIDAKRDGNYNKLVQSSFQRCDIDKLSLTGRSAMGDAGMLLHSGDEIPSDWVPPSLEIAFVPPADYEPPFDAAQRAIYEGKQRVEDIPPTRARTGTGSEEPAEMASSSSDSSSDSDSESDTEMVSDSTRQQTSQPSKFNGDFRYGYCTGEDLVGTYSGVFLFTQPGRMIRPVRQLWSGQIELVGPTEQLNLDIACTPDDVMDVIGLSHEQAIQASALVSSAAKGDTKAALAILGEDLKRPPLHPYTHIELSPMSMLSLAAQLTPFSDLNQSPRNMYQCQMGKQTMGTPVRAYQHRTDTKLYRIQNPQAPLVQNAAQGAFGMDEYPAGTNAVVAVIAYTGYDMEDAMIINKSAYERGFGHGSVYKTYTIDLADRMSKSGDGPKLVFTNHATQADKRVKQQMSSPQPSELEQSSSKKFVDTLELDGLPPIGLYVREGDPLYCVRDIITGKIKVARHKDSEPAYVDQVTLLSGGDGAGGSANGPLQRVAIKLRYNRNPVVGDKFSSRHGQKGVLSMLWPQEDMPFTESGMSPDIIINPHAFPSRMTIGMLVESMAGKAGALHGCFQDSTPFRFNERQRAVDYFGEQLEQSGYSYYGTEPMYSGMSGTELHAHIYIGVVYYQRLRHMVSDKSQVRATGPINNLTRQPVKGRKHHGGIRFGEMERDSLLAHGSAFLLQDRLMNCSDRHIAVVCRNCGQLISTLQNPRVSKSSDPGTSNSIVPMGGISSFSNSTNSTDTSSKYFCLSCKTGKYCVETALPYVFRYLANELAGMNIRLTLDMEEST